MFFALIPFPLTSERVEERPRDDHVVVDDDEEGDEEHAVAQALEGGRQAAEQLVGAEAAVLADAQLQEEERQAGERQHRAVRHQERAAAVLVALERKKREREREEIKIR